MKLFTQQIRAGRGLACFMLPWEPIRPLVVTSASSEDSAVTSHAVNAYVLNRRLQLCSDSTVTLAVERWEAESQWMCLDNVIKLVAILAKLKRGLKLVSGQAIIYPALRDMVDK
jgi:hypothetical protein